MAMASSHAAEYGELIQEDRVHGRLYYDPTIFQEEVEKIWHRQWVYVGHESEVAEPGDYVTRQLGLQPAIITRDKEGEIWVLLNRCMHRGNLVCQSERGNTQEFRCIYHGWTVQPQGRFTRSPVQRCLRCIFPQGRLWAGQGPTGGEVSRIHFCQPESDRHQFGRTPRICQGTD